MTGRELLNQLQAFSEKTLGEVVVVSPPSGGYGMIERLSILYAGPVVIHFDDGSKTPPPKGDGWKSEWPEPKIKL
jgi:hypothetical protein